MLVSVSWSTRTISPTVSPGLFARVTERLPLLAVLARLVAWVNLNHCVPTVMRLELVPTGILSLVWAGPRPRRTMPLVIWRKCVILKSPAPSCTTCPTGQASSAAWMPLVASPEPLPYVAALRLAHTVVRAGTPPEIPGLQVVSRSDGMSVKVPGVATGPGVKVGAGVGGTVAIGVPTGVPIGVAVGDGAAAVTMTTAAPVFQVESVVPPFEKNPTFTSYYPLALAHRTSPVVGEGGGLPAAEVLFFNPTS